MSSKPTKRPLESAIQNSILDYLRYFGVAFKMPATGVFDPTKKIFRTNVTNKGMFDILFLSKKFGVIFFEVKRDKAVLQNVRDKDKIEFKRKVEEQGIPCYVVNSVEGVMQYVK